MSGGQPSPIGEEEWMALVDDWNNWVKDNPKWQDEFEGLVSIPSLVKRGTKQVEKRTRLALAIRVCFEAEEVPDNPWYSPPPEPVRAGSCSEDGCDNSVYHDENGEQEYGDYSWPICGDCSSELEQQEIEEAKEEEKEKMWKKEQDERDLEHWPSSEELGGPSNEYGEPL